MPSESIRVVARFRPINSREKEEWARDGQTKYQGKSMVPVEIEEEIKVIKIQNDKSDKARPYKFTFDEVMWWATPQQKAFEIIAQPVCLDALKGFNGTVFAYGQTGSGKTWSSLVNLSVCHSSFSSVHTLDLRHRTSLISSLLFSLTVYKGVYT